MGFASITAWSTENEDFQTLIDKGLSCDPIFDVASSTWARVGNESFEDSLERISKSILKFSSCPDQNDNEELRKVFFRKYVSFYMQMPDGPKVDYPFSYRDVKRNMEEWRYIAKFIRINEDIFEKDKRVKKERDTRKIQQSQLQSRTSPVLNFNDAVLLHNPKELLDVMKSPLLIPDKTIYGGNLILDSQDGENSLRVKYGGFNAPLVGWVDIAYATIKITKRTINYSHSGLRIGGQIKVIGRYMKNTKYTTVSGEIKTMPLIELMYISD